MSKFGDKLFYREGTCPWWLCPVFDNPLRALFQNPAKILSPYVQPGHTVLDVGPGMGYFSFPLSDLVGQAGKVYGLDIQGQMLARLQKKVNAKKRDNIELKLYDGGAFGLEARFDFVLLFWMFHEVRNKESFVREIGGVLGKASKILIVEPWIHVLKTAFEEIPRHFEGIGMKPVEYPKVAFSRAVLLERT
jgi:ubiquinone/menaquinone biosynthesis C-methylase UbiE